MTTTEVIGLTYETHRVQVGLKGQRTFDPTKLLHPDVFIRTEDARDLRTGRVRKLTGVLTSRQNFSGVWTVNSKGTKLRNIDCNHRYDALVTFLTYNPDVVVEVEMHVYKDLTEEEERNEFTKANNSAGQTTSDYLQQYRKTLNIWEHINDAHRKNEFPIAVSHKKNENKKTMALHNLLHPYLARDEIPYSGPFANSAMDFIDELQTWNSGKSGLNTDGFLAFNTMKAFLKDYIAAFGEMTKSSIYWKMGIFQPMFRIWYDNKSHFNQDAMRSHFKKLTKGEGKNKVVYWSDKGAARSNVATSILDFLVMMNGTKKTNRMYIRHYLQDKGEVKRYDWGEFSP